MPAKKKSRPKEKKVKVQDLKTSERGEGPKAGAGNLKWGDIVLKRG